MYPVNGEVEGREIALKKLQKYKDVGKNNYLGPLNEKLEISMPAPSIKAENVKWLDRTEGPENFNIQVIFICKQKCNTIINNKNLDEMQRFVNLFTDHKLWSQMCLRKTSELQTLDASRCTKSAYNNFTTHFP